MAMIGSAANIMPAYLSTPICRLMTHCCAIDSKLLVNQYSTNPAGKKKNMNEKTKGIIHIIFACKGSAGAGFNQVWNRVDIVMSKGKI